MEIIKFIYPLVGHFGYIRTTKNLILHNNKMPYIIKNTEVRLANIGTLQEAHLFTITSGQYNKKI